MPKRPKRRKSKEELFLIQLRKAIDYALESIRLADRWEIRAKEAEFYLKAERRTKIEAAFQDQIEAARSLEVLKDDIAKDKS